MVARSLRPRRQYHLALFHSPTTVLRFLAGRNACHCVSRPHFYQLHKLAMLTYHDSEGFNWSSVMFVIVLLIALVYYVLRARHVYTGPVMLVAREH